MATTWTTRIFMKRLLLRAKKMEPVCFIIRPTISFLIKQDHYQETQEYLLTGIILLGPLTPTKDNNWIRWRVHYQKYRRKIRCFLREISPHKGHLMCLPKMSLVKALKIEISWANRRPKTVSHCWTAFLLKQNRCHNKGSWKVEVARESTLKVLCLIRIILISQTV